VHEEALAAENDPDEHCVQALIEVAPVTEENVPAGHGLHARRLPFSNVPARQGVHTPLTRTDPALQLVQESAPAENVNDPVGQNMHEAIDDEPVTVE
jgi:hypothetical protein